MAGLVSVAEVVGGCLQNLVVHGELIMDSVGLNCLRLLLVFRIRDWRCLGWFVAE